MSLRLPRGGLPARPAPCTAARTAPTLSRQARCVTMSPIPTGRGGSAIGDRGAIVAVCVIGTVRTRGHTRPRCPREGRDV